MRTSVHVNRPLRRLPGDVRVPRDHLLRRSIDLFPQPQVRRSTWGVVRRMWFALMFGQRQDGGVPAVRVQSGGRVDRKTQVVADVRTGNPFGLVFVKTRRPLSGKIDSTSIGL